MGMPCKVGLFSRHSGNFFSTRHWKVPEIQTGIFGWGKSALSLVYFKYTNLIGSLDVVHSLFNSPLTDYWLMIFRFESGEGFWTAIKYSNFLLKKFTFSVQRQFKDYVFFVFAWLISNILLHASLLRVAGLIENKYGVNTCQFFCWFFISYLQLV